MKKFFCFFITVLMCFSFFSCGKTGGYEKENKDDGDKTVVKLTVFDEVSSYKIIRPEKGSEAEKNAVSKLVKALQPVIGAIPKVGTDFDGETKKEILIGNTSRQETIETKKELFWGDYKIVVKSDKLVICAGSDSALSDAVDFFINNMINAEEKTVKVPAENGFLFESDRAFDTLSVEGTNISEFKILNNSLINDISDFENDVASLVLGYPLEKATNDAKIGDGGHYVVLDGSNINVNDYSITVEDGNIVLRGSHSSLSNAMDTFCNSYTHEIGKKKYDLTSYDNKSYKSNVKVKYTKEQIMMVLTDAYNDGKIIIGEEAQGNTVDTVEKCINRFVDATGTYPGMLGIDLATYGLSLMENDDTRQSKYLCDIVDFCAEGGIVTASSHFANPSGNIPDGEWQEPRGNLGYDTTLEGYQSAFDELLTEGTELNTTWKKELDTDARFLAALRDAGVTVLFRPLHESNGNWFWFCTIQGDHTLDASYLRRVWIYIYEYYTNDWGLTNLIWNYSQNVSSNISDVKGTTMSPWYCYPGDEYVDIVGVDWSTSGSLEITENNNYLGLVDLTRKIGAITEFGPGGSLKASNGEIQSELYSSMDLYSDLVKLRDNGYKFAYLLTWGSSWGIPTMGEGDNFMAQDMTLGRAEVKVLLDS